MSTTYCQKQFLLTYYTSTSKSLRTQFWHNTPLHLVHIKVHFNPYVIQVHRVVHSTLQPYLIIFRSSCGAGGFVICTGRHIPFDIFHPIVQVVNHFCTNFEQCWKMVANFWNWLLFWYFSKIADFSTEWIRDVVSHPEKAWITKMPWHILSRICFVWLIFQTSASWWLCFGSYVK